MINQTCAEVIVVDYSCPQDTGYYVKDNFPSVRVVSVEGEKYFSNWRARNAGAALAKSDMLVFCDADTLLAEGCIAWINKHLPENNFGFFERSSSAQFNEAGLKLATNQLRGFHVVPAAAFRRVGGYDEVLEGYAAGGDTDLEERLTLIKIDRFPLDPILVETVIEHDNEDRKKHHADSVPISYCAGLLYRAAKKALLRIRNCVELPLAMRQNIYGAARKAASALGSKQDSASLIVTVNLSPILMPRQLGYERGKQTLSLKVDVVLENKLAKIPD